MIEKINIQNVATFQPINGVEITELKKVNFIFGFNGSGKSTIAKYLHNLSLEESQKDLDFKDCTQKGYNDANHQILTFDENFTEANFKKSSLIKGVFSLHDESHKVTALDSIYYQKIITEQPQLLFDVFKEIFISIGKEHYELMMEETIEI